MVWPDLSSTWTNHDRTPDLLARKAAYSIFDRLDCIDPGTLDAQQEEGTIPYLRFTPEAQEIFNEWRAELEHRIRSGKESDLLEAHLAKYRSLVPSLALLIHLSDEGHGPVCKTALVRACAWVEYLESHARRMYAPALSPATSSAYALADRLQKSELHNGFTLREVYNNGWYALSEMEEALGAVELLEDLGWLEPVKEKKKGPGRPKTRYLVNPQIKDGA